MVVVSPDPLPEAPVEAAPAVAARGEVVLARVLGVACAGEPVCLLGVGEAGLLVVDGVGVPLLVGLGVSLGLTTEGVGLVGVGEPVEGLGVWVGVTEALAGGSTSTACAAGTATPTATARPATVSPVTVSPVASPTTARRPSRSGAAHTRFTDDNVPALR